MESKILGKLFGVDVRYPFHSSDLHDVINMFDFTTLFCTIDDFFKKISKTTKSESETMV